MFRVTASKGYAEVEIKMPKTIPITKDLWILTASKLTWEVWSRLGWNTNSDHVIKKDDWWSLAKRGDECEIMKKSVRRLRFNL